MNSDVYAEIMEHPHDAETLLARINEKLQKKWKLEPEDTVVLLTKVPLQASQRTNTVHIHSITKIFKN
jgi:pyruvate kinase